MIEDNQANMKLATDLLESFGFTVLQAFTAEEGLESALKQIPSLILMDISLPGINGLEATRLLKQDHATSNVPVVAVTAHAMEGHKEEALEAGCDDYLTKPIDAESVYKAIDKALRMSGESDG